MQGAARWSPGNSFNMVTVCGSMMTNTERREQDYFNGVCKLALLLTYKVINKQLDESPHNVNKMWNNVIRPAVFAEIEAAGPDWVAAANFSHNMPEADPYHAF
mgnify:CR=1 FL=1